MTTGRDLVAFDLETTGLSPKSDRIIEIGAVRFTADGDFLGELDILVDPSMPVPLAVQRLTGISDVDLAGQAAPVEAAAQLADFCAGTDLVAHGSMFDMAFCKALVPEAFSHRVVYDTLDLARILLPLEPGHGLQGLAARLRLPHPRPHRALDDAVATAHLLLAMVAETQGLQEDTRTEMLRVAAQADDPVHGFLRVAVGATARSRSVPVASAASAEAAPPPSAHSVEELIGTRSPLADRPGYEYRPGQLEMARAVAQTIGRGGRLLVEAGTGVGKTLGYLAPTALWLAGERGRRAVVATHTVTLQEQLLEREWPVVSGGLERPVVAAVLKGRRHYLSRRRWQRFVARGDVGAHGPDVERIRFKVKVLRWLEVTTTGDRGELRLTNSERGLWRHVESVTSDCLGSACANWGNAHCFMVAARRRASAAQLVVTNHGMLLATDGEESGVLGDHGALVVDEAHRLEEAATRARGHSLGGGDIDLVLDRLPDATDAQLRAAVIAVRDAAHRLFGDAKGTLIDLLGGPGAGNGTVAVNDALLEDDRMQILLRSAEHSVQTQRHAAELLRGSGGAMLRDGFPQPERADEEVLLAAEALEDMAMAIIDVLLTQRPGHVAWLELRAEQAELHDAAVALGNELGDGLLDRARATVLTSATLAVAGDFGFIRERLGLQRNTEELILESPFDFLRQSLCIVAGDVPPYDDPDFERVLATLVGDIAHRLGGRTLALFTGYSALRRVHDILRRRLDGAGIALLGQSLDGTRRQILQSFLSNPRSVLLGTSSFWEGIDIPGDALQCVVIAKLPFLVPTDPLVAARTAEMADPFGAFVLPEAVLRLRQGFGRLIRSESDRGAVVIADPRILDRDYGRRFLDALPKAGVTREPVAAVAHRVAGFVAASRSEGGQSQR
ncbi:MAG: helicase C-terminal domain-containing protein [Candidatus Dormibacteria bacterium]